jgi:hypothetical protein
MVNKLYLLVGVPGSGKSTYANRIVKSAYGYQLNMAICEADNFPGLYINGRINFHLLETAHIYCKMCVEERMKSGYKTIVQSNTNLELGTFGSKEFEGSKSSKGILAYIRLAEKYDYEVHIILPNFDLLYFDGIKGRKRQVQHLISARGFDRPNSVEGHIGFKYVPSDKILKMIEKFDEVKSKYMKLSKLHNPSDILKFII